MRILLILFLVLLVCRDTFGISEDELRDVIARGVHGQQITLDASPITLTSPLVIEKLAWFSMVGVGSERPKIKYTGDPAQPAIILDDCYQCEIGRFWIEGNCASAIAIRTTGDGQWPISSQNYVHDIHIQKCPIGVFIDSRAHDANNEFHRIERVHVNRADEGFKIWGSQAHRIQFDGCSTSGCRIGLHGAKGNYWSWRNGQATGNEIDFLGRNFPIMMEIHNHRSEVGTIFADLVGQVVIRNVTWDGGRPDGRSWQLSIGGHGPAIVENVFLNSANGKLLRCKVSSDVASVTGLQVDYRAPRNGDTSQVPVWAPRSTHLAGAPVLRRIRFGTQWEWGLQPLRPRPDLSRGLFDIDHWTKSGDTLRSYTVLGRVTLPEEKYDWLRLSAGGIDLHLIRSNTDGKKLRAVRNGQQVASFGGEWQAGETHTFAIWWDRDHPNNIVGVMLGDVIAGGQEQAGGGRLPEPLLPNDAGYDWFGVNVEDVRAWDRALTPEEFGIVR